MTELVLFDYHRSSASYRVRIGLNLKGVAWRRIDVSLLDGDQRSDAHLRRNPQGFVPTLEVDGRPLSQSLAILDWLDRTHPAPAFLPDDPFARAAAQARTLLIACDIHPLNNLRVLGYLKRTLGQDEAARDEWYRHWVREGFTALERMAGDGPYLGGAAPDLSDICLVPQMYNARRFALDLAPFPRLAAIDAALQRLDGFAAAHPDRVAGAA
jgi:maleylacetoacetate isomerase